MNGKEMNDDAFEGTLVLEKLVSIGKLDEFYEAVDSDNFEQAKKLMKRAQIDQDTIAIVLSKMVESEE